MTSKFLGSKAGMPEASCASQVSGFLVGARPTILCCASIPTAHFIGSKAAPLVKEGATACEGPSQVAAAADVVFTIVG